MKKKARGDKNSTLLLRARIKELYLNDVSVDDICIACNITRPAFYYHKNQDLKRGSNWDSIALRNARNAESVRDKEAVFLKTLIASFEKFIESSQELDAGVLEKLHQYAQTYWRLKAPKNDEFTMQNKFEQAAKDTIKAIADLALAEENHEVVKFLSDNADEIINKIFKPKNLKGL